MVTTYDPEDRRKHLDIVQGIVGRMAAASTKAKEWLLPVATATYGYALVKTDVWVALLGMVAVGMFATLDAHYLRQERAFRVLFREVAAGRVTDYDTNARRYLNKPNGDDADERDENCRWSSVVLSWSLGGFYALVVVTGVAVVVVAAVRR